MLGSTNNLFFLVRKNRRGILFILSTVLVIYLMHIIISMDSHENSIPSNTTSISAISALSEPCLVTNHVQTIRELQKTININPARYVVEELLELTTFNSSICTIQKEDERQSFVVTIVNSARHNFMERQVIRKTWGSLLKYKDWYIRTVFLLGQSDHCLNTTRMEDPDIKGSVRKEDDSLLEEHRKHGDIVIGAFTDTYRNLTYKHLMGYKFVLEHCSEADWVVKTDDDVFVNLPSILDMRTEELTRNSSQTSKEKPFDIYCHMYDHDKPTRCKDCLTGKWFSTREEWPEDTYPVFCLGNDYAISMDWLKKIYSVRGLGGFFFVDDVFILGKLREIAEKKYNDTTRKLSIWKKVIDLRSIANVTEKFNKNELNVDLFALLSLTNFKIEMESIWNNALRNVSSKAILVSKS